MATDVRDSNAVVPSALQRQRLYRVDHAAIGSGYGMLHFAIVALCAMLSLAYMSWSILSQ
jgi:hypothetical protein